VKKVAIIGSGHNALISACYLAKSGLSVEVFERDAVIGGAVSTVQRWPGYEVDRGSSLHVMIRFTGIVEELELSKCGLEYLDADPWAFAPFWRGRAGDSEQVAITFQSDLIKTCESIEQVAGLKDAEAYQAFVTDWRARNERIFEIFQTEPTPKAMGQSLFRSRQKGSWRKALKLGRNDGLTRSRDFLLPADSLLDQHFDSEELKTALAWLGAQSGPPTHEVATADLMAWFALLHGTPPWRAIGGSGSLTKALAVRLKQLGGVIHTNCAISEITFENNAVTGLRTQNGEKVTANFVLAGCHIMHTAKMIEKHPVSKMVAQRVRVGNGLGMAVRLATNGLPAYPAAKGKPGSYAGMQLLVPNRQHLRNAYADFLAGRSPAEPAVLAMSFSSIDPTTAPSGKHNITLWAQWHPHRLNQSNWADQREVATEAIIKQVEHAAPGFTETIEHVFTQSPADIEEELALVNANVMHVEMTLDSTFWWRPLPEISRYRMPIEGLYITGASTHPGGGVFGASGRSAARALLSDAGY
jgi:phytoene dehydrogenase-like protein